ncbi:flagellar basal body L-ring protein FlgH [Sphingomonas japonica]
MGALAKFVAGLAAGGALVLGMAIAAPPANAQLFGKKKDKVAFVATAAPAPVAAPANGSIFQAGDGYAALYEGQRARRVGDLLTIVLVERTVATKSAGSQLDSSGGFGITPPTVGPFSFNPGAAKVGGNRGFDGVGTAGQANALSGEVSVTVAEVYPNGTMLVQGQKSVTLNRGDEFVQIKGLVRTADIDANNRVASTRVADAQIAYTGKGDVARASRQGWLSRFFQVISPF